MGKKLPPGAWTNSRKVHYENKVVKPVLCDPCQLCDFFGCFYVLLVYFVFGQLYLLRISRRKEL